MCSRLGFFLKRLEHKVYKYEQALNYKVARAYCNGTRTKYGKKSSITVHYRTCFRIVPRVEIR